MPRSDMSCRTVAVVIVIVILAVGAHASDGWNERNVNARAATAGGRQKLTLQAFVRAGRLDDLRWRDFSDYRADVKKFYSRSGYAPAWLKDGKPTTEALEIIDILRDADSQGLRPEDYDSSRWPERLARLQHPHSSSDEVRFDAALTVCVMRYVSDLRLGRINPRYFKFGLDVGPKGIDLPRFVQRLAGGSDLESEVERIEPAFPGYRQLRRALWRYMRLAEQDDGEPLPAPADMGYPGPQYTGFIRLVRLLRLLGDLPASYSAADATSRVYDAALLQGVRHFQERHGLPATGYLNVDTIEQLNVPLTRRVEQIRLALERYRWLHYDFRRPAILVNIPGFHLYAFDRQGKVALSMTVDVGDDFADSRTPVLQAAVEYLVFRPYWDVPLGIQREEFVPFLEKHPGFLAQHHFELITPAGERIPSANVSAERLQQLRAGSVRIRQRPGPENPMGLVKFMFPNRYRVYLHDIPSRDFGFVLPQRLVSHGCVHVEHPEELAAWILRDQPQWTLKRVRHAMHQGQYNLKIDLAKPLPVLIVYTTASADEHGDIHFYRDIYGYDTELLAALAKGYPYPK